jgi:methylmalonyl-CoA/ethylmalonyl-CoA epimerase
MRFDHVGIVTDTLERGRAVLEGCLDIQGWTEEFSDAINGVQVQFCRDSSGVCYELIAPLSSESPVIGALTAKHNILNHVAYLVDDLATEAARLRKTGNHPAGPPKPAIAYAGRRIQFFVTPLRFIIEMIEAPDHAHTYKVCL